MKIATKNIYIIVNGTYNTALSGGDINILEMIKRFSQEYNVTVITNGFFKSIIEKSNILNTQIIMTDNTLNDITSPFQIIKSYFSRANKTRKIISAKLSSLDQKDTVFIMASEFYCDIMILDLLKGYKKILIYNMVAPNPFFGFSQKLHFPTLREIHYWLVSLFSFISLFLWDKNKEVQVISVTENIKQDLKKSPFVNKYPIRTAYVGVNKWIGRPFEYSEKKFDFVWIGRDHPQKGIDDLEYILLKLKTKRPNFTIQIFGGASERLLRYTASNNLEKNVTIRGKIYGDEKFKALSESKIFLFTSHFESFGIVVVENLSVGNSVVGYKIPSSVCNFPDQINYVDMFNKDQFVEISLKALSSFPEKNKIEQNKLYCNRFNWDETYQVYKTIIDSN